MNRTWWSRSQSYQPQVESSAWKVKTEWDEWDDWDTRGEWEASSSVKTESVFPQVKSPEKVEDPLAKKRKKPMVSDVSASQLDRSIGLDLDILAPKQAVNVFLGRYLGRAIQAGEDYHYSTVALEKGFQSHLKAPGWSNNTYPGSVSETEKAAERSAASSFVADADVREAARLLPPPMRKIRNKIREEHEKEITLPGGYKLKRDVEKCKQRQNDYYNKYQDICRTAIWDLNA